MTLKYVAIPAPAIFDERIKPHHLRVLVIVAYYGSLSDRTAYPSYKTLATAAGVSRRVLMSYIKHLVECGYIIKRERLRTNGSKSTNVYSVPLNIEIEADDADESTEVCQGTGVVMSHSTTPGDTGQHQGGDTGQHLHNHLSVNKKNKNTKKADRVKLEEWEKNIGSILCVAMMQSWVKDNQYSVEKIGKLIGEFRLKMIAGGNLYADFKAAFQNYLNSGYLSLGVDQVKDTAATVAPRKEFFDRGVQL